MISLAPVLIRSTVARYHWDPFTGLGGKHISAHQETLWSFRPTLVTRAEPERTPVRTVASSNRYLVNDGTFSLTCGQVFAS